jgi:hypothetical protein
MSCVWKGLIECLHLKITPEAFCTLIKTKNRDTPDMMINNVPISPQIQKNNIDHISEIKVKDVNKGYLCSTADPLLLLVGQIYNVTIEHIYCGAKIIYENKNASRIIYVASNQGHFWADKVKNKKQKKINKKQKI